MDYKNLFEKFDGEGKLLLPDAEVLFAAIPWSEHPSFEGGGAETHYHIRKDRRTIQLPSCEDSP